MLEHLLGHLLHDPQLLLHLLRVEDGDARLVLRVPRLHVGVGLRAQVVGDEVVGELGGYSMPESPTEGDLKVDTFENLKVTTDWREYIHVTTRR